MDINKDGSLTKDEVQAAGSKFGKYMKGVSWDEIIEKADMDGNGSISF